MKEYELVIETTQPTCGKKPPVRHEFLEVQVESPLAYVQSLEDGAQTEIHVELETEDQILIIAQHPMERVRYEFTEI